MNRNDSTATIPLGDATVFELAKFMNIHPYVIVDMISLRDGRSIRESEVLDHPSAVWLHSVFSDPEQVSRLPEEYHSLNQDRSWHAEYEEDHRASA